MTQNNHTQSENQHFQHENWNEKSKDWVKVFQPQIETNNQFYMIIKKRKSIKKQICINDFSFQNQSRSTKIFEKMTFSREINISNSQILRLSIFFFLFFFFIKCMQSMTMTLFRRCMYAKLHVIWSKSLLYIFSLINHIDSLCIQALSLKLSSLYSHFSSFLCTLRVLLSRF